MRLPPASGAQASRYPRERECHKVLGPTLGVPSRVASPMRPALAFAVAVAALLAPAALAQQHEHRGNGMAVVLHDGPEGGRAVVGAYTHFGFALLDNDAAPLPHQNAQFVVTQAGRVVFSTTDTHEYDALFSFDIRFTRPGPYQVTAMSGEMEMGLFEGEVIEPVNATVATVEFATSAPAPASRVVDVTLSILGPDGAILPHTDAIVEFRSASDGALAARTHLHIHEEPIAFSQALGPGTDFEAQVIAYQAFNRGRSDDVPAVLARFPVSVGPAAVPAPPLPQLAPPTVLEQRGAMASADGLTLHATYDPNNQVGVLQTARIVGTVVDDANFTPKPHVDFALALSGPRGLVFSTASGHEYDGSFEYVFVPDAPGLYGGTLTATFDQTELGVPVQIEVVPPVVPVVGGTGPIMFHVDGLDAVVAGKETNLTFRAMGPTGPAKHSEVDVTVFHDDEVPLYQFKLHTHESGSTNAVLILPHEGDWSLRVDGLPTVPEPSRYPSTLFAFAVAPDATLEAPGATVDDVASRAAIPAPAALALVALAALAFARRRAVK